MNKRIGIYPGTFDPITTGHMDIIQKALKLVDTLIIAVAEHPSKQPIFSLKERTDMVSKDIEPLFSEGNIEVCGFEGLLVSFAKEHNANLLIRGLRAVSDFEYEFQLAGINSKLDSEIQTVFLPAAEKTHFVASRFVKEAARLGGDVSELVSPNVLKKIQDYYK